MNDEITLTTDELADRWKVTKLTLARWRQKNVGPHYIKMGEGKQSTIIYRLKDILKHERERLVKTGA
jgi:hypothetical protein